MEELFKARKEKLSVFKSLRQKMAKGNKRIDVPDGIYTKCDACGESYLTTDLEKQLYVCPNCGQHLKMDARSRLHVVFDSGKYRELYTNLKTTDPLTFPGYNEKLAGLQEKTGLDEAVLVGSGKIGGQKTVVCVMDSRFLMGSMGGVVGEKITKGIEHATKWRRPIIIFTTSGGARMQEGIISLMQMAKTSAALAKHHEAGLLYISYITHPTTGGVTASFATLGDIIIGEPNALIGFAGPRVIESTIKQQLPEGFQRTEFMLDQGFIDLIVERKEMKDKLSLLLKLHSKGGL
ncbi:MAG: acetyl-CoA carboxylase, carboxyltransferase subunit beta [Coprobacillaceae bacterium]